MVVGTLGGVAIASSSRRGSRFTAKKACVHRCGSFGDCPIPSLRRVRPLGGPAETRFLIGGASGDTTDGFDWCIQDSDDAPTGGDGSDIFLFARLVVDDTGDAGDGLLSSFARLWNSSAACLGRQLATRSTDCLRDRWQPKNLDGGFANCHRLRGQHLAHDALPPRPIDAGHLDRAVVVGKTQESVKTVEFDLKIVSRVC